MRLEERVNTYGSYLKKKYGRRVFRLGISFKRECQHKVENGGCIFCLPETFSSEEDGAFEGSYEDIGIKQIELLLPKIKRGIGLNTDEEGAFLAYFQSGLPEVVDNQELKKMLIKTARYPEIVGIIIASKPSHIKEEIFEMLKELPTDVCIELGMQTVHQKSLDFLNRNQKTTDTDEALKLCEKYELSTGVHLMIGIPGETVDDILATIDYINENEIITEVKLHNLVVYQRTPLADYPKEMLDSIPDLEEYLEILGLIIRRLRKDITISRFFTSNVKGNKKALNPFLGVKREWMNRLTNYLNDYEIVQGKQ